MVKIAAVFFTIFCGVIWGQEGEIDCGLEVTPSEKVRSGIVGYDLKVTLTYSGKGQKMVTQNDTFNLIAVTKSGKEVATVYQGCDHARLPLPSDYQLLKNGEIATYEIFVIAFKKEGKWCLSWEDSLGGVHECKLGTIEDVKLVMKYTNEVKKNVSLKVGKDQFFEVPKEEIWKGSVRSAKISLIR